MIIRSILENPRRARNFDYGNDYEDTLNWLNSLPQTKQSKRAIACLIAGYQRRMQNCESMSRMARMSLAIEFTIPEGMSTQEAIDLITQFSGDLSQLHKALGGNGLKVDSLKVISASQKNDMD